MSDAVKTAEYVEVPSAEGRLPAVCDWIERCYDRGETVAVYCPDEAEARELDVTLWTWRQQSFVPHVRIEQAEQPLIEPVVIFSAEPPDLESDAVVLVADGELPAWAARYGHIVDLAPTYDKALRQSARERYAACQVAGYRMRFVKAS